ncbi:MAG: DnaJ domain-containing protein [Magnetococcales bacterium]|nr:DnaJ domain-containing protein [Magnetococcales bacterium]
MNFPIPWRTVSTDPSPIAPARRVEEAVLPPGMRRVKSTCKACGKSLGIKYPEAVTCWKVQCPSCGQVIAIELVGGRKCLVFNVQGRRTVERIGLTDQRRRFFRARCFVCDETLVVPESEAGRLRGCHGCGLEYTVREEGEVYYETAVRINDEMTTYREKVQESSGYLTNKNTAFFLGEEPGPGQKGGRSGIEPSATLLALRRESEQLRVDYRQALAEKEALTRKLAQEQERVSALENGAEAGLEVCVTGLQARLAELVRERDRIGEERDVLQNRMQAHNEALRALDEELAKRARLESRLTQLEASLRRSEESVEVLRRERDGARLVLQASETAQAQAKEGLRQALEERKGLEARLLAAREAVARLEERLARADQGSGSVHGARLRELEAENARLAARVAEGERLLQRARDLEREVERLRAPGAGEMTELEEGESWYCEEGQEGCIRADSEVGMARRVLGLKGQPTVARIKTAFRRRVKRYHPDRVTSLGLDLRDLAHKKMQEINRAYGLLMKEYGNG